MRNDLKKILAKELRFLAIETRERMHLTQMEMGCRLHMSESSYSDIETGKSMCGTLTASLLLNMQDNPNAFLHKLADKFEECYEKELHIV